MLLLGCSAELASSLEEAQADAIVVALDEVGIGASKEPSGPGERGRFRVRVAQGDLAPALAVLRDLGLPRDRTPGYAELFAERGLVPSAADERARHAAALSGELARSLESMDGIVRARVHLGLADARPRMLDTAAGRARASVLIEHRADARIDDDAVRALVAGAIPELSADDVAVVRSPTRAARPREPRLAHVGPITVTRGTEGALKAILAASFTFNLVLAAALIVVRARRRSAETSARPQSS